MKSWNNQMENSGNKKLKKQLLLAVESKCSKIRY